MFGKRITAAICKTDKEREKKPKPLIQGSSEAQSVGTSPLTRQPLLQHFLDFKKMLISSSLAVIIAFFAISSFLVDPLMNFITKPVAQRGISVIYTAVSEALITKFKVALIAAVVVMSPFILWQVWGFIRPALYEKEIRKFKQLFLISVLLFIAGVGFSYGMVYRMAIDFFLISGENIATPMFSIDKYVSFLFGFLIPFGIAFQLPVFVYLSVRMGWVTFLKLAVARKYVAFAILVIAAALTPPDMVSQVALALPMYLLYETGVQIARHVKPIAVQG